MRLTLWILISFCVNVVSASIDCYSELEFSQKYPDPGNADAFICTCEPGRFKAPNQTCVYCPLGTYKSDIGTHECTKCNSEDTLGFIFGSVAHGATSADNCTCQETLIENRRNGSLLCTCPAGKKFGTERRCIACVEGEDGRRRVKVGPGMHECYDCPAFLNYENATSCTWHTSNVCTDPEYFTESQDNPGISKNVTVLPIDDAIAVSTPLNREQATFLAYYFMTKHCDIIADVPTSNVILTQSQDTLICTSANVTGRLINVTEPKKTSVFDRRLAHIDCKMPAYHSPICTRGYKPDLYYDASTEKIEIGCVPCPTGHGYMPGLPTDTCTECPAGTYLHVLSGTCTPCAPGTWQNEFGQTTCLDCYANSFNHLEGQISDRQCIDCPYETSGDKNGLVSVKECKPCTEPFIFNKERRCEPCALGYEKNGQICTACPIDSYRVSEHAWNCTTCPLGTTTQSPNDQLLQTLAGKNKPQALASNDGVGTNAVMYPQFLASWAPPDNFKEFIFFSEWGFDELYLRQLDVSTGQVLTLCSLSPPEHPGQGTPTIIKVGPDDATLYVVDKQYRSISKINMNNILSEWVMERWVGGYKNTGTEEHDGQGTNAFFHKILAIDFTPDDKNMIVVECNSQVFNSDNGVKVKIRRIALDTGLVTTIGLVGTNHTEQTYMKVSSSMPTGMSMAPDGESIFITEGPANRIWQIDISSIRRGETSPWGGEGAFCMYELSANAGVKPRPCDIIATLVAGDVAGRPGYLDGVGTYARFESPTSLDRSVDGSSLLIAESTQTQNRLRRLHISTQDITTVSASADVETFGDVSHAIYSRDGTNVYVAYLHTIRRISMSDTGVASTSPTQCVCAKTDVLGCCPAGEEFNNTTQRCQRCGMQKYKSKAGMHKCELCANGTVSSASRHFCHCAQPIFLEGHCQPYGMNYPFGRRHDDSGYFAWVDAQGDYLDIEVPTDFTELTEMIAGYAHGCPEMETGGQHYIAIIVPSGNKRYTYVRCHPYDYYTCRRQNNINNITHSNFATMRTITIIKNATSMCPSTACPAGYAAGILGTCECAPGYGASAKDVCELCPSNTFRAQIGLGACRECPRNSTSAQGSTRCACSAESIWTGRGDCEECEPGTSKNWTRDVCEKCEAGKFRLKGMTGCVDCADKHYSAPGSATCTKCSPGQKGTVGKQFCEDCPAGSFIENEDNECQECTENTFQPNTKSTTCLDCPPGTRRNLQQPAKSCEGCRGLMFWNTTTQICEDCPPGQFPKVTGANMNCVSAIEKPEFGSIVALVHNFKLRNDSKVIFQAVRPAIEQDKIAELDVFLFFNKQSTEMDNFVSNLEKMTFSVEVREVILRRRLFAQDATTCDIDGCPYLVLIKQKGPESKSGTKQKITYPVPHNDNESDNNQTVVIVILSVFGLGILFLIYLSCIKRSGNVIYSEIGA